MSVLKNNGIHGSKNNHWLTPRPIIKALGPFDLDPCCEEKMPWKTARKMWHERGLEREWSGRVWCNPPYTRVEPWAVKMIENRNGIMLVSAKSADTRWFQLLLDRCHSFLLMAGRISFCYPDGTVSGGAFLSSAFFAMTPFDTEKIRRAGFQGHICQVRR